jgi:hypothetical protein
MAAIQAGKSEMTDKPKPPAGMLYWKSSPFGLAPEAQVYPAGSGTPVGSYLAKHELTETEMRLPLHELAQNHPPPKPEAENG